MNRSAAGAATPIPSTAESTEIAGVITPSPNTIPAANSSMYVTTVSGAGMPTRLVGRSCASSASVPPSPWLSARSTTVAYFTHTTRISAHVISDRMPSTCSGVGVKPRPAVKHCLNAYSGLVPMSPNTTPSAASASGAVRASCSGPGAEDRVRASGSASIPAKATRSAAAIRSHRDRDAQLDAALGANVQVVRKRASVAQQR